MYIFSNAVRKEIINEQQREVCTDDKSLQLTTNETGLMKILQAIYSVSKVGHGHL